MRRELVLNENELLDFGRKLGGELDRGVVVALVGDLGAGKTTLAKAIASGLGVRETITSPTFTIIHEYDSGRLPFYHFDVYRLDDPEEMDILGWEDYFFGKGVTVVEWADKIPELIPQDAVCISISYADDNPKVRQVEIYEG
jgi:tRNA threonylcarbamoyladenosine biosynthesis protein TsaE